ncbi:MAG TPA: hypothetical protein EYP41_14565 [Anaerolineae bacterium]|nr:hypothetical protein [Anaerolineae bacterium]
MKKLTFLTIGGLVTAVLLTLFFTASPATSAQERFLPEDTPDAEVGLAIYNERCTVCHGDTAQGDGPQAIEAALEPTVFADPEFRLTAQPQRMYDFITNGNLANGMPPFGPASSNPLAEMDRWHLIAAIYSFSTPPESIALGEEIVTEQGGAEWPDTDYWFTRTNEDALADLEAGDFGLDTADLSDEEKMAVVDYGRSQSYLFLDPFAPPEPIAEAVISGQVTNGSTDEPVTAGTVTLRAFTFDLEEMLNETTELDEDGRYSFTVTDVDPDWVYLVSAENDDLTFNSSAAQIERSDPELDLPVTVYNKTTDPSVIDVEQIHLVINFGEDTVQVSELYVFNNNDTAVFVGETGNTEDGTVEMFLPAGAENIDFRRALGSFDNFVAATEVVATGTGWADTVAVRPGSGSSVLLVSYELPYDDNLLLAHPLGYPVKQASAILPDVGITIKGDGWIAQDTRPSEFGDILSYLNSDMTAAGALNLELDGRPRQVAVGEQGGSFLVRDNQTELIVGVVSLLIVLAIAAWFVHKWRNPEPQLADSDALIYAIAELDDAYDAGEIKENEYQQKRNSLKAELESIWPG